MDKSIRILVVEDDRLIVTSLERLLTDFGFQIVGITDNTDEAISLFATEKPDVVLCDISLPGAINGIELAKKFAIIAPTPVIFLTGHKEQAIFHKASEADPAGYLTKPIKREDLEYAILLALQRKPAAAKEERQVSSVFEDCFFTKIGNKLRKIPFVDILFVEVEGKYSALQVGEKKIHAKISLKDLLEKLPQEQFIRVSRNHVVNLQHINDIDVSAGELSIGKNRLSVSRTYKENLFKRLNLI